MAKAAKAPSPTLRDQRVRKLKELREAGYQPYANDFIPELTCADVHARHLEDEAEKLNEQDLTYTVAGRIVAIRRHGKSTFFNIRDRSATLQIFASMKKVGEATYEHLKTLDLGDFVGVAGSPMRTRTGELSLSADGLRILTKALQPPAEKWHGVKDVETRFRQRYIDLIANEGVRETFRKRALVLRHIRQFLDQRDYLEVETPILQDVAGGASAAPFVTHHNALDQDLYLRIATELHLKRLVVGGLERVYEMGRVFRNEGLSRQHNPEFTSIEFYQAYATASDLIQLSEELVHELAVQVGGGEMLSYKDHQLSFARPFKVIRMADAVAEHLGLEPLGDIQSVLKAAEIVFDHSLETDPIDVVIANLNDDELSWLSGAEGESPADLLKSARSAYLKSADRRADLITMATMLDEKLDATRRRALALHLLYASFDHEVEETLIQPTFITDYPLPASPLSRQHDDDPAVVDRFEFFIGGMEVANAFSELGDPEEQRRRFERQVTLRARGDDEAPELDEDFINALEVGMPPTAGEGIGIDRLVMILTNSPNIREVILFPQLRRIAEPSENEGGEATSEKS